ncbi:terminase family protein [Candidatus Pacearchaeota archaeon]|nr:terminase family protein [Candidatus Pacearchaeota archaeon]
MSSVLSIEQIKVVGELMALYKPLGTPHSNFHRSLALVRWLFGGNQSSKTYTNMTDLCMTLMNINPYRIVENGMFWVAIESWEQVRDVLWAEYIQKFIPESHFEKNGVDYGQDKVPRKLRLKNGHSVEFKAFNQGRELFQGRKIDACYCDEQCHRDFLGILNEIQARLLVKEGYLSWSLTPVRAQPDLEDRLIDLPSTDEVFYANLNLNRKSRGGYISDARINQMISEWPEEVQATRIEGRFASFQGAVYRTFSRAVHSCKPFSIPKNWRRYRGIDFGFTNPFVCLWLAKDGDENWYVYDEYYKARTGISEHISAIKSMSGAEHYEGTYADPENAENRAELRKAGIINLIARNDVAPGIELIQSKLKIKENGKPSLQIFNTCKALLREMPSYSYPKGTASRNAKDVPVAKNDHTLDALRYAMFTVEKPRKKGRVIIAA